MKHSHASRRSSGFTLIELLVVISIIAALAALSFAGVTAALRKARTTEGQVAASGLAQAVNNFYSEYNRLPNLSQQFTTNAGEGVDLLRILLAQEDAANNPVNTRGINFLSVKEGKNQRGGLDYGAQGNSPQAQGLYDPFGQPFTVVLNTNYQDVLTFNVGGRTYNLRGEQVAVFSPGADEQLGTRDDITSFQR
jgi:prepilin-type N-terminal cleavage/methylation domain-containing protein